MDRVMGMEVVVGRIGRAAGCAWWCVLAGVVGVWGSGVVGVSEVVWFSVSCGMLGAWILFKGGFRVVFLWVGVGALMGGYTGVRTGYVDHRRVDVLAGVMEGGTAIVRLRGVVVEGAGFARGRREVWEPVMWSGVRGDCVVRVEGVFVGGEDGEGRQEIGEPSPRPSPGGRGGKSGEWVGSGGLVCVVGLGEEVEGVGVGDAVEVMGVLRGNRGERNIGGRDWIGVANMEGRAGTVWVVGGGGIEVLGRGGGLWDGAMRLRGVVRERAMGALGLGGESGVGGIDRGDHGAGGVVLGALVLGERSVEGREIERGFARVGVGHVLAVSGFHVALLVGVCALFLRVIGVERMFVEGAVVCVALGLMWVLVPVRVPMVRAMVLIGALMLGRGLGRRYDTMAVLGWVAVGLMVWRPVDVLGLGWQLSVGVTGLLVWMGRGGAMFNGRRGVGKRSTGKRVAGGGAVKWVRDVFLVNWACWLLAMPVIQLHVGTVSVVGFVMAVVVAGMAGVLMVLGYVQALVGVVWPGLGEETVFVVEWAAGFVAGFVGWVDGMGWFSLRGVNLGVWWTVVATGLAWLVLVGARWLSRKRLVVGCLVLLVWGGVVYRSGAFVEGMRVEMIDVGDGSAYLVRSGWESVLYDCGSLDYRVGRTVERVAWSRGVRKIGAAIVSHDNVDHFNGLVELARGGVGFERVCVGGAMEREPSDAWAAVRGELIGYGVEIVEMSVGDGFDFGEGRVVCVGGGEMRKGFTTNDSSLVMRMEIQTGAGDRAVLLTGDIGVKGIGMLDEGDLGGVVVMELPHHGSMNAAVGGFLEMVDPEVVLQSTGQERVDGRWEGFGGGRVWHASGDRGGAWVEILLSGEVVSGWAVEE